MLVAQVNTRLLLTARGAFIYAKWRLSGDIVDNELLPANGIISRRISTFMASKGRHLEVNAASLRLIPIVTLCYTCFLFIFAAHDSEQIGM